MNLCKKCNADIPEGYNYCNNEACLLPSIYNPAVEWVPIESGQMPEANNTYDCTLKRSDGYIWVERIYIDEAILALMLKGTVKFNIIAWRNLPEPYKPIAVDESAITFENGSKINLR